MVPKKRNLEEVDEVFDRDVSRMFICNVLWERLTYFLEQAEIYNLEKSEWTIDKASNQRMVYVPKDTVVEFMKKVSGVLTISVHTDSIGYFYSTD